MTPNPAMSSPEFPATPSADRRIGNGKPACDEGGVLAPDWSKNNIQNDDL